MPVITIRIPHTVTPVQAYELGFNSGEVGANMENCHFTVWSSPENTKEWERGKADAEAAQEGETP